MSVDEFIDGVSAEARDAVRVLLRRAYDAGFREALASAGQPVVAPTDHPVPPAPAPTVAPVEWVAEPKGDAEDALDLDGAEGEDGADTAEVLPVRPILPLATIGTLRRRIIRTFDLERFDIDVVICRSGDADRRQLKSSARLGLYRREEE